MANVLEYLGKRPQIGAGVFLADSARVIGDTEIGEQSSIWFGTVLRGDINRVVIGHHTNIQDNSVCHVADEFACVVGNYVTVGHRVILHGCTVSDEVLVGMGAVLMNGVVVGEQSIIGAAALLTEGAAGATGVAGVRVPREGDQPTRADGTGQDQGLGGEILPRGGKLSRTQPLTGLTYEPEGICSVAVMRVLVVASLLAVRIWIWSPSSV